MRALTPLVLAAFLLAIALPVAAAPSADAPAPKCIGVPCDVLNIVCGVVKKGWTCVKIDEPRCAGEACDAINAVCIKLAGARCVG